MAFSDPQSVDVGGVKSLPKTLTGPQNSIFSLTDGTVSLTISQTTNRTRQRSLAQISTKKISTNPVSDLKSFASAGLHVVLDKPIDVFTEAELVEMAEGLVLWLSDSTYANFKKLAGGQS